jgi:adenylate cyclase
MRRAGIGIHTGPAVVGQMGYGAAGALPAVGDAVNVASRIQELPKQDDGQLVISVQVVSRTGVEGARCARHQVVVRNHAEPLVSYAITEVGLDVAISTTPATARSSAGDAAQTGLAQRRVVHG